jgi:hypothetical protein
MHIIPDLKKLEAKYRQPAGRYWGPLREVHDREGEPTTSDRRSSATRSSIR